MKTKEELEEAIKDHIIRYKEIIFGSDAPVCMTFLEELRKQIIDQKIYDQKSPRMGGTSKKYQDR